MSSTVRTEVILMRADPAPMLEVTAAQRTTVEAALRRDLTAIARWSGRRPETVRRWLAAFRAEGLAGVGDAPRQGRPPKADARYLAALETAVATSPRSLGLPFDVWTSARLSAYLHQQSGVRIAPGWLRVLLKRQRFACGRPKHRLDHLQDPEEVAACEAALRVAGEKVQAEPDRCELHYEDETHLETN